MVIILAGILGRSFAANDEFAIICSKSAVYRIQDRLIVKLASNSG
jgi:hypothetical protein